MDTADSQKTASVESTTGDTPIRRGAGPSSSSDSSQEPPPRAAANRHPRPSAEGRLGQPSTPPTISPSSIRPSAIAYWSPRRNPFVPSIGSSTQNLPRASPALEQRSIASPTSSAATPGSSDLTASATLAMTSRPSEVT